MTCPGFENSVSYYFCVIDRTISDQFPELLLSGDKRTKLFQANLFADHGIDPIDDIIQICVYCIDSDIILDRLHGYSFSSSIAGDLFKPPKDERVMRNDEIY